MRVGLALGGGVARGIAHAGVLAVLEHERIPIHCVAGTSSGAIFGALFCAGLNGSQIWELAARVSWWSVARPVWPRRGFFSFAPLERLMIETIGGDLTFQDLQIPFASVATDLERGEPYTFYSGKIAPAVRASCSVPGLVVPMELDGRFLCDGGISDNIPVAAARWLGADYVIGVNLFDPLRREPRGPLAAGFSAVETMVRRAGSGITSCDLLISPELIGQSYLRFSGREGLLERGRKATELKLPALRAALEADHPAPEITRPPVELPAGDRRN